MRLDRNIPPVPPNTKPSGKYALIKLRVAKPTIYTDLQQALIPLKALDMGDTDDTHFFVIRLKDKYAAPALLAYAEAAAKDDPEYAAEIMELARLAETHLNKHIPD